MIVAASLRGSGQRQSLYVILHVKGHWKVPRRGGLGRLMRMQHGIASWFATGQLASAESPHRSHYP